MAIWKLSRWGGDITVTYHGLLTHENVGSMEAEAERVVEEWVFEQAQPFDIIETLRGRYVRLNAPRGRM